MRKEYDFTKAIKLSDLILGSNHIPNLNLQSFSKSKLGRELNTIRIPDTPLAKGDTIVNNNSGYNRETERTIQQARNGINMSRSFPDVDSLMKDLDDPHVHAVFRVDYETSNDPISMFVDKDAAEEWGFYLTTPNNIVNSTVIRYPEDEPNKMIDKVESLLHGFIGAINSDEGKEYVRSYVDHFIKHLREWDSDNKHTELSGQLGRKDWVVGDINPIPGSLKISLIWGDIVTEVNL